MSLWQKLASVRGTDRLTEFREDEPGPRGCRASRLADTPLQEERRAKPGAWGWPRKNRLNFKKQEKKLVSAAETGRNSPWNMGTAARLVPEEASRLGGSEPGRGQLGTCAGLPLAEDLNRTYRPWD